jgi:hypothetical protein
VGNIDRRCLKRCRYNPCSTYHKQQICWVFSGSHNSAAEYSGLLGYDAMLSGKKLLSFRGL